MKSLSIIGSTGSIGTQTLDVISRFPDRFRVAGLAAGSRVDVLAQQVRTFQPDLVAVPDDRAATGLRRALEELHVDCLPEIQVGPEGLVALATLPHVQMMINAVVGALGLKPTLAALRAGKAVALANKETLVAAGELVISTARHHGVPVIPIDSEHSALFQCLVGEDVRKVRRLILTASGGPFRGQKDLSHVTKEQALKHPRWVMGAKITIDSATLMNKALEMIEARWLFGVPMDQVDVVIHPQSTIHSAVEFVDGNIMAQLGPTDMRLPIQYALTYPERLPGFLEPLDLTRLGSLTFEAPDTATFPSLNYARQAVAAGGTMPAVMNAANEIAVQRFLADEIPFRAIFSIVERVMDRHKPVPAHDLSVITEADEWARRTAASLDRW